MSQNTIAAISTPPGDGGIGVIRISGDDAISIADKVFKSLSGKNLCELSGYTALFGTVCENGEPIDEVVATVFTAPKSYTGENVCELSCHGGQYVTSAVLRAVLSAGAKMAAPGEFTERAFLNGKINLTEAESVMGLISAKSREELKLQFAAKQGQTSRETEQIEALLLELSANFAAYSDYPDEDLPDLSHESFIRLTDEAENRLHKLLSSFDKGKVIRDGVNTAIVGKPNVGKSTLMNMLSCEERSIVTDIAGTTRDVIENTVHFAGINLNLADTAGIRTATDKVEGVGVELAKKRLTSAQLILAVFDISTPPDDDDRAIISMLTPDNTVIVLNKSDKVAADGWNIFGGYKTAVISAQNGDGGDNLEETVRSLLGISEIDPSAAMLLNERQHDLAEKAYSYVREANELLKSGYTMDAVNVCIDEALAMLYTLDGKRVTNEVADEVFRRFCVGK